MCLVKSFKHLKTKYMKTLADIRLLSYAKQKMLYRLLLK